MNSNHLMSRFVFLVPLLAAASCSSPDLPPAGGRDSRPNGMENPAPKGPGGRESILPGAGDVARRAVILRVVGEIADFPRASARAVQFFEPRRERMVRWIQREKIWDAASENEQAFLATPMAANPGGEQIPAETASDSLYLILWALGVARGLPPYDASPRSILDLAAAMPDVGEPTRGFVERARLRPGKEIRDARKVADMWAWRAHARERIEKKEFPAKEELEKLSKNVREKAQRENFQLGPMKDGESFLRELIHFAAHFARQEGLLQKTLDGDFPAFGRAYSQASDEEFQRLRLIAVTRLHTLNWLLGFTRSWDAPRRLEDVLGSQ